MENATSTNLMTITKKVQEKELLLPDFQRGFVWDMEMQKKLIASVLAKMPLGSILMLEADKGDYGCRILGRRDTPVFDGAKQDAYVLLDGQQRMTVLANVFSNLLYYDYENPGNAMTDYKKLISADLQSRFFLKIPCIAELKEENDWFHLRNLQFPIGNPDSGEERLDFLTRDILDDIICLSFDDKTKEEYAPHAECPERIHHFCMRENNYLIPLYLLIGDNHNNCHENRLNNVLQDITADVVRYRLEKEYDVLSQEEQKNAFATKILPADFMDGVIKEGAVQRSVLEQQWCNMARVCWADNMKKYLHSCITNLDLHQIVVKKSERDRAIDIYENLNIGGVSLSTFELVMARAAKDKLPGNKNLFESITEYVQTERVYAQCMIPERIRQYAKWEKYSASDAMACYDDKKNQLNRKYTECFLNVLSLLSYVPDYNAASLETAYIKQRKILGLNEKSITGNWEKACKGIDRACYFLQARCGVRKIKEVNYNLMLVLLGYIFANDEFYQNEKVIQLLEAWYWSAIFAGRYDKDQNVHIIEDMRNMLNTIQETIKKTIQKSDMVWLKEMFQDIFEVKGFSDKPTLLLQTSVTPKTVIKNSLCQFYLSEVYRDLMTDNVLHTFYENADSLEQHHIVPIGMLKGNTYKELEKNHREDKHNIFNSPLNFAYISRESNRTIASNSVEFYVGLCNRDAVLELHLDSIGEGQQEVTEENLGKLLGDRLERVRNDVGKRIRTYLYMED